MLRSQPALVFGSLALSLVLLGSCSPEASESTPQPADAPTEPRPADAPGSGSPGRAKVPEATRTGDEPVDSATHGGLHGTILFRGEAPERFPIGADKSAECRHHPDVDQRQNRVVVNDGKVTGAFVRIASGYDESNVPPLAAEAATIDQKGCMYVPRVLGLRVGQRLRVTNLDPTAHNVHTTPKRNDGLNVNMAKGQDPLELVFERAERPVPFKCDIHPWMGAAVFVEEHPWFAVSDERGAFRIASVPPGEYVVEVLHEELGRSNGRVAVSAGKSTGFTLTLAR
jgi:plastocyanin